MKKYIIAKMEPDWILPYSKWKNNIPVVIEGNHPEYIKGTRFDWGFVQTAIDDGYEVTIIPAKINRTNCTHSDGFDRTGFALGTKEGSYTLYDCPICHQNRGILTTKEKQKHYLADYNWDYYDRKGY
jgi:hypothetical protein